MLAALKTGQVTYFPYVCDTRSKEEKKTVASRHNLRKQSKKATYVDWRIQIQFPAAYLFTYLPSRYLIVEVVSRYIIHTAHGVYQRPGS